MKYLQLVQSALWNRPAQWPVDQSPELLRLNAMQGTGALVYPMVLGQQDIPVADKQQMKAVCMHNMQQQVKMTHVFRQAWTALEQAGVRAVLMKGAGLAALYPDPSLRTWGDIDLFVGKDQYHPACAVMRDTFPDALKFDEELDHYKHYNLIADGVSIEVHRVSVSIQHPIDERRYARMEAYGMTNCRQLTTNGLTVRVPEPTFNALFVFMHAWEHTLTQGANVRQLCDLALQLHHYKDTIDRKRLGQWLNALHLSEVWQVYMQMLVNGLALSADEAPFYSEDADLTERGRLLMHDLLAGKLVAPKSTEPAPKNRLVRKIHTMRERMRNAQRMQSYSPTYARHMKAEVLLHGALRLFAKDRHWE
jgi:hypothetical protein